jgi:hypothetical protein
MCKPKSGMGNEMEKSLDLRAPQAQIFAYTSATPRLIVRLQADEFDPPSDPFEPGTEAKPEKFLIIPVAGGVPKNISECPKESDHYKENPPATADIDIFPVSENVCDATTLYPNGANCKDKMLVLVTDTPQLVHEPGQTAQFYPIEGLAYAMARTTNESLLAMQSGVIRVGTSGLKFTLPDGGVIPLKDGNFLRMNGPAVLNGTSGILLQAGGQIENAVGSMLTAYPANTNVTPNAERPYYIRPGKRVVLPAGLMIPSAANGYIRLPVSTQ